jgi:hypothetical protein
MSIAETSVVKTSGSRLNKLNMFVPLKLGDSSALKVGRLS